MSIKLAFLGTGWINEVHAVSAAQIPDIQMYAAVNPHLDKAEKFAAKHGLQRVFPSFEALLEAGEVNAVVIGTPNANHAPAAVACLKAGVHVLVEKPMAVNAPEAARMVEAAEQTGSVLMVAHCWRFDNEVQWLRTQVEAGTLGEIVRTKGYGVHVNWGPSGWFTRKVDAGGGAMADVGVHPLDTVRFLLGDPQPVSVYARISTRYTSADVDDTGVILIEWDNGATSYLESGWWQPHSDGQESATQLYGTLGFGSVYPTRLELPDREKQSVEVIDPGFVFPRPQQAPQEMFDRQMDHFVDCVLNHRLPLSSGEQGWINMRIVDAAYESSQTNQVVRL